jgi:predicted  nucleic acid-binding Zn-ribbon protein
MTDEARPYQGRYQSEEARLAAMERRVAELEAFKSVIEERRIHSDRRFDTIENQNRALEHKLEAGLDAIQTQINRLMFTVVTAVIVAVINGIIRINGGG